MLKNGRIVAPFTLLLFRSFLQTLFLGCQSSRSRFYRPTILRSAPPGKRQKVGERGAYLPASRMCKGEHLGYKLLPIFNDRMANKGGEIPFRGFNACMQHRWGWGLPSDSQVFPFLHRKLSLCHLLGSVGKCTGQVTPKKGATDHPSGAPGPDKAVGFPSPMREAGRPCTAFYRVQNPKAF
jgi:hypothetical protein